MSRVRCRGGGGAAYCSVSSSAKEEPAAQGGCRHERSDLRNTSATVPASSTSAAARRASGSYGPPVRWRTVRRTAPGPRGGLEDDILDPGVRVMTDWEQALVRAGVGRPPSGSGRPGPAARAYIDVAAHTLLPWLFRPAHGQPTGGALDPRPGRPRPPRRTTARRRCARGSSSGRRCDPRSPQRTTVSRATESGTGDADEVAILGRSRGQPPGAGTGSASTTALRCDPRPPRRATAISGGDAVLARPVSLRSLVALEGDRHSSRSWRTYWSTSSYDPQLPRGTTANVALARAELVAASRFSVAPEGDRQSVGVGLTVAVARLAILGHPKGRDRQCTAASSTRSTSTSCDPRSPRKATAMTRPSSPTP